MSKSKKTKFNLDAVKSNLEDNTVGGIDKYGADLLKAKEMYNFEFIYLDKLSPHIENIYREFGNPEKDIEQLKESIIENGLFHNLVVMPELDEKGKETGYYKIISGENRYNALTMLRDEGDDRFNLAPCKIQKVEEIDGQLQIIYANEDIRKISEFEKLIATVQVNARLELKKQQGEKLKGRRQEQIAKMLSISASQVNKYLAINKGTEKLKSAFKEKIVGMADASSLARLSPEGQNIALDIIVNNKSVYAEDIKKEIQEIEQQELPNEEFIKQLEILKNKYTNKPKKEKTVEEKALKNIKSFAKKTEKITVSIDELGNVEDDEVREEIENIIKSLEETLSQLKEKITDENK